MTDIATLPASSGPEFRIVPDKKLLDLSKDKNPLLRGTGTRISNFPEGPAPTVSWTGGKISPRLWFLIRAWCLHTYNQVKGETLLDLFYNPITEAWAINPPLQAYSTGLSVHRIPGNDQEEATQALAMKKLDAYIPREPDHKRLYRQGFTLFGSIHHHCSAGAGQSQADREDEIGRPGLHITLGSLSSPKMSMHHRTVFQGVQYPTEINSFFAVPPDLTAPVLVPPVIRLCDWLTQDRLIAVNSIPGKYSTTTRTGFSYYQNQATWFDDLDDDPPRPARPTGKPSVTHSRVNEPQDVWLRELKSKDFKWSRFVDGYGWSWALKNQGNQAVYAAFQLLAALEEGEFSHLFWEQALNYQNLNPEHSALLNPDTLIVLMNSLEVILDSEQYDLLMALLTDLKDFFK